MNIDELIEILRAHADADWKSDRRIEAFIKFVDSTGGYILSYKSAGFDECKQEVLEGDNLDES